MQSVQQDFGQYQFRRLFERAVWSSKGGNRNYLRWANLADTLRWLPGRSADFDQRRTRQRDRTFHLAQRQDHARGRGTLSARFQGG